MARIGTDARARPPEGRWREVICAGAELFHQRGYSGTSMAAIADVVGIHKSSLYNYVASKEELLEIIICEVDEGGIETLRMLDEAAGTALQRLRLYVVVSFVRNAERRAESSVFLHEYRELGPTRRCGVIEKRDAYDAFLWDLLTRGQEEGSIKPDVNLRLTTIMINTLLSSAQQWYDPLGPLRARELADIHADMVIAAVRATPLAHEAHTPCQMRAS